VDDEEPVRDYLAEVLRIEGYECLCFSKSLEALSYLARSSSPADLLLADISLPDMTGIELLREVKTKYPGLPVILISGMYELALAVDALEAGADDYLKKPVRPGDVITLVSRYLAPDFQRQEAVQEALREFVASQPADPGASAQIKEVFQKLGFKRYETYEHSARVASYCRLFGRSYRLTEEDLRHLELGALLHDIGKIGIPRNVLLKPGKLTGEEWRVMRMHPSIGHSLLASFPQLHLEAEIVYSHHERYDGSGYPRGLRGKDIPLEARIFSIVDAYDAITSDRPYRAAQSPEKAVLEIQTMSGTQFDPDLVAEFLRLSAQDLEVIRQRYPGNAE
jgi:response regulator RpfG family c-di-GMP phosphodiesterase